MKLYLDYFAKLAKLKALEMMYKMKPTRELKRQIDQLKRELNNYF